MCNFMISTLVKFEIDKNFQYSTLNVSTFSHTKRTALQGKFQKILNYFAQIDERRKTIKKQPFEMFEMQLFE
jgi:hypothetical protein